MQTYQYRAARDDGSIISGHIDGASSSQATSILVGRGLHPLSLAPATGPATTRRRAGRRELAVVFRGIAVLVSAGVPLERALESSEPLARGALRSTLAEARRQLREGQGLARALEVGQGVVPGVVVGLLRVGDRGGQLASALEESATHLEREADLAGKIRQALAYPCVLAVAGATSVIVIGTVVLPRFAQLLGDLGQELPAMTRGLLALSSFLRSYGLFLAVAVAGAALLLTQWLATPAGRLRCDRALLQAPLLGSVRRALATTRVARALGAMLRAGMPLLPALDAATEAAGDHAIAERLQRAREQVAQGQPLAQALGRERALSDNALQLIAVGEGSGQLAAMAARAGDLAQGEAERALASLVAFLEPGLILVFGGVIALVAAGLLQAVYSLRPGMP